jgi:hypothetical protein
MGECFFMRDMSLPEGRGGVAGGRGGAHQSDGPARHGYRFFRQNFGPARPVAYVDGDGGVSVTALPLRLPRRLDKVVCGARVLVHVLDPRWPP